MIKADHTLQRLFTLFGVIILGICSFKVLEDFRQYVDLVFADETGYMVLSFFFPQKIEEGYGPVYSMFYKFLHLFFTDTIDLHYANLIIQSFLPAFGLFFFLRFFGICIYNSLWMSLGLLCSSLTMAFNWWPRISHFTLFLFFFFLIIASRIKNPTKVFGCSAFAAFCFSYIRPEAFMTFLALSGWTVLWYVVYGRKSLRLARYEKWLIAAGLFLIASVFYKVGPATSGGSRLGIALGQHYMYNYIEWNKLPLTDWIYWKEVLVQTFGHPKSLSEFIQNGREELIHHVTYNIGHYFRQAYTEVPGVFFPEKIFHFPPWLGWIILTAMAVLRMLYVGTGSFFRQLSKHLLRYWPLLFVILLFIGPTVVASFLIYPREHYLIIQLALVYFLVVLWLQPHNERPIQPNVKVQTVLLALTAFACVAVTPGISDYPTYKVWGEYTVVKNVKGINAIRSFGIREEKVNLLECEGGFSAYVGGNYKWIIGIYKEESFYTYLRKEKVNMIYVTTVMAEARLYKNDHEWHDFQKKYRQKGWRKFSIPGSPDYIFVADSLLKR